MTRTAALALALLMPAGAAVAAGPMTMDHGAMSPAKAPPPAGAATAADAAKAADPATAADRAFAASTDAMMKGMDVKPSGDPDRDFVAMMLPHHRGAVDMAKVELRYGKDPLLRRLAADIVKAQAIEIAEMEAWQKAHAK